MAGFSTLATVALVGSSLIGAGAQVYQGYQANQAAQQQARNLEAQGKADFAQSQRQAQEQALQTKFVLSQQQAMAASSGAGAGLEAPTIVRLMTQTAERGVQAQENTMYTGEERRSIYNQTAATTRQSGQLSFIGSLIGGVGTLIGGAGDYAKAKQLGLAW